MTPTSEQLAILDVAKTAHTTNLTCNSLAGTGKTTMLELIERAVKAKPILYLCFNKKIADDATERMLSTTTVRTFNSIGHRIWARSIQPKTISLKKDKSRDILRAIIDDTPKKDAGPLWDSFWEVINGVGMAKSLGYVPEGQFSNA